MIFMNYLQSVNLLREKHEWNKAMNRNSTTKIWKHIVPYYPKATFDWRILASGHVDEMAYELGTMDQTLPFPELKRRSLINQRSKTVDRDPAFSKIIRQGLPGFE